MAKKNLIVFDIDGTLTDTVAIHQNAFRKSLQSIGIPEFSNSFGTFKHHTDSHIVKTIYESTFHQNCDKTIIEEFEEYLYKEIVQHRIEEIKGAKKVVEELETNTDFGVCFATGSLYKPAVLKLERIGINFNSLQIVASNELEEREQIVNKAIEKSKAYYKTEHFDRIISFGDGLWDLITAHNLAIDFVGIGQTNIDTLKNKGMKKHYPDFEHFQLSAL